MKFFAPFQISENISETPEGYLCCYNVAIGRVGEMIYGVGETPLKPGPDGKVHVTRSAEELFRKETITSFEGKPVTLLHPDDFVNPQNWRALSMGLVQNVRRGEAAQENDLVADLLITDAKAIALVKAGLREVSCGYEAEYVETGVGRGVQTNIIGNHLALVQEGRAGSAYAINDHKGKGSMTIKEKIKAIFAKAQDEAMDAAGCKDENTETPETKQGFVSLKAVKDYFDEKFEAMSKSNNSGQDKGKDSEEQDPQTGKPAKPVAKDKEGEEGEEKSAMDKMMDAVKDLGERLSKLEGKGEDEEEEESEDDDFEESTMAGEKKTGDSAAGGDEDDEDDLAARVEILAPGMAVGKGVKGKALIAAYATTDGKAVIDTFTGGKRPDVKDSKYVDVLFVGVSEALKAKRRPQLAVARQRVKDEFLSSLETPPGAKSAEEVNEINAKHWGQAK